jgi:hypothetical protein
MKKTQSSTLLRLLGLAMLAACFSAGHANAQMLQGKFTLPTEVRWGQATLPAGEYSFTLDSVDRYCPLRIRRGNTNVGMFFAAAQDGNYSDHAELRIEKGTVRALNLPNLGMVFVYAPQHHKYLTAPEEREIAQIVPVATKGK